MITMSICLSVCLSFTCVSWRRKSSSCSSGSFSRTRVAKARTFSSGKSQSSNFKAICRCMCAEEEGGGKAKGGRREGQGNEKGGSREGGWRREEEEREEGEGGRVKEGKREGQ